MEISSETLGFAHLTQLTIK